MVLSRGVSLELKKWSTVESSVEIGRGSDKALDLPLTEDFTKFKKMAFG
jgi:hypothetical protein